MPLGSCVVSSIYPLESLLASPPAGHKAGVEADQPAQGQDEKLAHGNQLSGGAGQSSAHRGQE